MGNLALLYYDLQQRTSLDGKFNYFSAEPNNGLIDVTRMAWRNNKTNQIDEVPSVLLTEYELNAAQWIANVTALLQVGKGTAGVGSELSKDPYQNLYYGEKTGFSYNLPYIEKSQIRGSLKNDWVSILGKTTYLGKAKDFLSQLGKVVSPGGGIEDMQIYNKTNFRSVKISFPLYNTLDITSTLQNFSFVTLFEFQNLKTRTTYNTFIPPKIYTVDCIGVGGIYMPAAYVSDYNVTSIGTLRKLSDMDVSLGSAGNGGTLIPEAYKVEITLTELIAQSSNIMAGALGERKLSVISSFGNTTPAPQGGTTRSPAGRAPVIP